MEMLFHASKGDLYALEENTIWIAVECIVQLQEYFWEQISIPSYNMINYAHNLLKYKMGDGTHLPKFQYFIFHICSDSDLVDFFFFYIFDQPF
jgi:hypothetical protein